MKNLLIVCLICMVVVLYGRKTGETIGKAFQRVGENAYEVTREIINKEMER